MDTSKIPGQLGGLSVTWAYIALFSVVVFLILLILLHILKPDLDPTWHMVSEYAIGHYGWMMQVAFGCLAMSCVCIAISGWSLVETTSGRIGLALLILAAVGLTIAAINNTDPVNTPAAAMSSHGRMHGFGFMIGVPSLTIATILVSYSLRVHQSWQWMRLQLLWSSHLTWISIIVMIAIIFLLLPKNDGRFGPAVLIGLPNRLWVLACCAWILIVSSGILKLKNE